MPHLDLGSETMPQAGGDARESSVRDQSKVSSRLQEQVAPIRVALDSGLPPAEQQQPEQDANADADGERSRSMDPDPHGELALSIVQFAAFMHYAEEGQTLEVDIMRLGALETTCSVDFASLPSQFEGVFFKGVSGTVTFAAHERVKTVNVEFFDNDSYNGLANEVMMGLSNPKNCKLGLYLQQSRIKIIDDDVFPTSKFHEGLRKLKEGSYLEESWRTARNFAMLVEFFKFGFSCTRRGSRKLLVADQINNVVWFSQLFIMKMLINDLQGASDGDGPMDIMIAVYALALGVPYAITHYLAYRRQFWGVGGGVRRVLLQNLLANFLHYEEGSRDNVNIFEWCGTYNHEVETLISSGYIQFFKLFAAFGRILFSLGFVTFISINLYHTYGRAHVFMFLVPFPLMIPAIYLYMRMREQASDIMRAETVQHKIVLETYVGQAVDHYRTIADYWSRPIVLRRTNDKITEYNKGLVSQTARQTNDEAFFGWVIQIVEFAAILAGGMLVTRGVILLGTFTALLSALKGAAGQFQVAFVTLIRMQSCYVGLWKVVEFMNVPTDLLQRKATLQNKRGELADFIRKRSKDPSGIAEDAVPICVENVTFEYAFRNKVVFSNANASFSQGTLIAIMGAHSSGKSTLLQILADVLMPRSDGRVFVPPHLRVLHVRFREKLWQRPLADTLFFGILVSKRVSKVQDLSNEDKERGLKICKRLGLDDTVIQCVENDLYPNDSLVSQASRLSCRSSTSTTLQMITVQQEANRVALHLAYTTRYKVQLARALITDPEVLLIHKPISFATTKEASAIVKLLRAFVDERGVENDPAMKQFRRPRTCMITLEKPFHLEEMDNVVSVKDGKIHKLDDEEFQKELSIQKHTCNHAKVFHSYVGEDSGTESPESSGDAPETPKMSKETKDSSRIFV